MSTSLPPMTRPDSALASVRELVDAYGRAHQVEVWFWQRIDEEWTLGAGTSLPSGPAPGADAVPVENPIGGESRVEIGGPLGTGGGDAATFLALALSRALQREAESRSFGREIAERYEEITLLYTISEILGSVISLDEAARTILREVIDTMAVGRASLWIYEPASETLELVAAVGGEVQSGPIPIDDASSITAAVFRDRRPMILESDEDFPRPEAPAESTVRESFLAVPVSYTPPHGEPRTIGVINLHGRRIAEGFSAGDHKLISAIASQIGAAVENNRLVAESLRQERIVREMELAHDLQLKLLPSLDAFRTHADVAARCSPADSVGGDFYHLFRLPGGRFGVVIGDVSSHGFAAALIMALTMSAISIHASEGDPPAEVLRRVHRALIDELESTEMYLTLFYALIDPAERRVTFANAGHPHAFRVSRAGEVDRLLATNPPFGLTDLDHYDEAALPWDPGEDLLFLFTDGLSDALGTHGGEQALVDRVRHGRNRPLDQLLESLFAFEPRESDVPADDRTALLIRV